MTSLYRTCRPVFKFAVSQFFRKLTLKGESLTESGPALIVCNHPNFMLDSLVIASTFDRELWFLAKSTIFKGPFVSSLLKSLHVIPVYRRQDNPEEMTRNLETFRVAAASLEQHRAIALFPEGMSMGERKVHPIKTGAARIAFQAEQASHFKLGLTIQPIGITYTDIDRFRGSATISVGQPIRVASYKEQYEQDAQTAVKALTDEIESNIKALTVELSDLQFENLVEKIGALYQARATSVDDHQRLRIIARNVESLAPRNAAVKLEVERKLDTFLDLASEFKFEAPDIAESKSNLIFMCALVPVVIFGVITHYLPYRLIGPIAKRLSTHPVDLGSLKFAAGLVVFPLWYFCIGFLCLLFGLGIVSTLLLTLAVIGSGYFTNNYLNQVRLHLIFALWPGQSNPLNLLRIMRDELIDDLEQLRVE